MQERTCKKFCQGGINTSTGLRTYKLNSEVIEARAKSKTTLKKNTAKNGHSQSCPLGCIVVADSPTTVNKLLSNGYTISDICIQPAKV